MKFLDFFSGIGGFHTGLENAGMKCAGWCEFDKFAQESYKAIYNTEGLYFNNDIRNINGKDLPKTDLWAFGFPCQDISIAGKMQGIKEGTRSGLFYEVMRLLDECEESGNKPKWLIAENVKNLLSIDRGYTFFQVLTEMEKRGYSIEWKVYNSKDYRVPQSRERIYIVGYHGNESGRKLLPIRKESKSTLKKIIDGTQFDRVYDSNGTSCTLMAKGGTGTGLYSRVAVKIKNATEKGYIDTYIGDGIDLNYINSATRRGRVQPQQSQTLTTNGSVGVLVDNNPIRIRRLTPRECWRLQGFSDSQYEAAAAVNSNNQLYKQAGNAVTVNVVEEIGKHIMTVNKELEEIEKDTLNNGI